MPRSYVVVDATMPLDQTTLVWPGDAQFSRKLTASHAAGDGVEVSRLELSSHHGSHVDAPSHFLPQGEGLEVYPLELLWGPCLIVDLPNEGEQISAEQLARAVDTRRPERLLLRTENSRQRRLSCSEFVRDYVALSEGAATWLVERGVRLVGIDALSIAPFSDPLPVHQRLLGAGLLIVEGLLLEAVTAGEWELCCAPLRLVNADGAPARVLLRRAAD